VLGVGSYSRLSPYLETCCLRLSASLSYEKTMEEVEVQTGRRVSQKSQQRLVQRQQFEEAHSDEPVAQMSLDGGMVRLRTPQGQPSEWKEYKALSLGEQKQGMAWFKDNDALVEWANQLPMGERVDCLGDGHDGVWGLYEQIAQPERRNEILDWYHLRENLHKIPGSNKRLKQVEDLLWQGAVDEASQLLEDCKSEEARKFRGYLQRHQDRIPNYQYYQAEGITIGSGDVESLIKRISARIKISGASWKVTHVPQVLAHRCAYLNGTLSPQRVFLSRQ
jgi:hypothetical protein